MQEKRIRRLPVVDQSDRWHRHALEMCCEPSCIFLSIWKNDLPQN
jgi:hypothetical protein